MYAPVAQALLRVCVCVAIETNDKRPTTHGQARGENGKNAVEIRLCSNVSGGKKHKHKQNKQHNE